MAGLSPAVVKCQGKNIGGGCVLSLDRSKMCIYVSVCGDFTSHGMGKGSTWG